jgi:aldehyde dehydrogenase (NAD+)
MVEEYGHWINGEWVVPDGAEWLETKNPATGETLARFPRGTGEDVRAAVKAAFDAFPSWSRMPPPHRGDVLLEAARIFARRKEELGALVTREMGKVLPEGLGDVQEAIDFYKYMAGEGRRLQGETTTSELPDKMCFTLHLPVGPVGLITPWNFPIAIPSWKSAAALISGCTVVFKPSSMTPLCGARFCEVLDEAGIPPGVFNMVVGSGGVVGTALVDHPDIRAISFTGGVDTGRRVYTQGAKRLIKVGLELGGKNAIILMDDADVDLAMEGIVFGAFGTAGQRCTATSRLIVHERIFDSVVDRLVREAKALRLGDPLDPDVDVGPVASADQEKKILDYIDVGKEEGAQLLCGGGKLTGGAYDKGHFIEPTIFVTEPGHRIATEEIFGPVLCVLRARDYEDAVRIANGVKYGLSSSIYTQDVKWAFRAMKDLEAGITYVNAPTIGAEVHMPFGGVKETGFTREAGTTAIEEFTYVKSVYVDYSGRLQRAQIDTDRIVGG